MQTNLFNRDFAQGKFMKSKSGISLIAVLLFMLVATIAATATWKWITSEGKSSASRMLKREAYQSSMAGIENARAWMTFHANDMGALIKQYLDDPNHAPINLDDRLRPLQRAGQAYHVWLTGVNTEQSTYKVKILSSGEARNDSRHTEVAIFNVDGLYHVTVPGQKAKKTVNFEFNYYGGSTHTEGHTYMHSMVINGNFSGSNPLYTETDLIVTGNVTMSGNSVGADGTACIGGNLDGSNGVFGKDFYVGGNAINFTFPTYSEAKNEVACTTTPCLSYNITGDVYIEGNLDGGPQNQDFPHSLTLNGRWTTNYSAHTATVGENLCLGPNGQVYFSSLPQSDRRFEVGKHLYAQPGTNRVNPILLAPSVFSSNMSNSSHYNWVYLGQQAGSLVYLPGAKAQKYYKDESPNYRNGANYTFFGTQVYQSGKTNQAPADGLTGYSTDQYFLDYNPPTIAFRYQDGQTTKVDPGAMYANFYINNHLLAGGADAGESPITSFFTETSSHGCNTSLKTIKYEHAETHNVLFPSCEVYPWFKSSGTVKGETAEIPSTQPTSIVCAEHVKTYCDNIWQSTPGSGCDGSDYKVPDILVTAYDRFEQYANKGCTVTTIDDNFSKNLNTCYSNNTVDAETAERNLYNGYQVVKVSYSEKKDPKVPLKGKFIIIVTNPLGQIGLPPTTEDSYAMVYLTQGSTGSIQPAVETVGGNVPTYNYFIYTKNDMSSVLFNNEIFSGSIYASVENCAKASDFKARRIDFNADLISDLASSNIICDAEEGANCGGIITSTSPSSSSSSITSDVDLVDGRDVYYISMAPQLGVSLESQSKSSETLPSLSATDKVVPNPSYIILPRVIYLPDDPYGSLSNYYNVIPLNGADLTKSNVTITSCTAAQGTSGTFSTYNATHLYEAGNAKLNRGTYKCVTQATGTNYPGIPFWVVIGSSKRTTPTISFTTPSQVIGTSETKTVSATVTKHSQDITLNVYCPVNKPANWTYTQSSQTSALSYTQNGSICSFTIPGSDGTEDKTYPLFDVTTDGAVSGTIKFEIQVGEGYLPGSPSITDVHIASVGTLKRIPATSAQIDAFCAEEANAGVCPPAAERADWPDCNISDVWVEPSGTSFIEDYKNNSWTVTVGGAGNVSLTQKSSKCVVIIPALSYTLSSFAAGTTKELPATAKAKISTLKVAFGGQVESGKNPVVQVTVEGSGTTTCDKSSAGTTGCSITVSGGKMVTLSIDKTLGDNEGFSYWKCSGPSCPTDYALDNAIYESFYVTDNGTTVTAYFNEADKHCFFDEFRSNMAACNDQNTDKYCVETGTTVASTSNAKWHLVGGSLSDVSNNYDKSISYSGAKGGYVKIMSTVNAGKAGTLKALVRVPRAASSGGALKDNVKNSGFILRANENSSQYLILNVYADHRNKLIAQICNESRTSCLSGEFERDGYTLGISQSNMVMITATITKTDLLTVTAYDDDFYGEPRVYSKSFDLSKLTNSYNATPNEYVGFIMGDANFKIYGIGWISEEYASQCHETPPILKCSFAARAVDGMIPLGEEVTPWVGHSAWFDTKNYSCEKKYYYYNGGDTESDACGYAAVGAGNSADCETGYTFAASGAGEHGFYSNDGVEVKTAKAGMLCRLSGTDQMWAATDENSRAHCGRFWTGNFTPCSHHASLYSGAMYVSAGEEQTITFDGDAIVNMRGATLNIVAENEDGNEVEVWLYSDASNRTGDDDFPSRSAIMMTSMESFNVVENFSGETRGFDPEKVKQIAFKNNGTTPVVITSVNTVCSNAVGVERCSATLNENTWNIEAVITNKTSVKNYKVVGTRNGTTFSGTTPCAGSWTTSPTVDGTSASKVLFDCEDDPYAHQGQTYAFSVSVSSGDNPNNENTVTTPCSVSPEVMGSITCQTAVSRNAVAVGEDNPQISVTLTGCPARGCPYEIYLANTKIESCPSGGATTCATTVVRTASKDLTTGTGEYTYYVRSPDKSEVSWAVPFTCTPRSFTVRESVTPVSVTCPAAVTNQNAQEAVVVTPTVTGCGTAGCSYTVSSATTGGTGSYTSGSMNFYNVNGSGTVSHTLTFTNADGESDHCSFNVTYAAGTNGGGGGDEPSGSATCEWYYDGNSYTQLYPGANNVIMKISNTGVSSSITTTFSCPTANISASTNCSNGSCGDVTIQTPSAVGDYGCTLQTSSGTTLCSPTLHVVAPFTCSVSPTGAVASNSNVTFSVALPDGAGGSGFYNCGFYKDDVCVDNGCYNAITAGNKSFAITSTTNLQYKCGVTNTTYSACTQNVALNENAAAIQNCSGLSQTIRTGTALALSPTVTNCSGGCNYSIDSVTSDGEIVSLVSHTDYDWTSETAMTSLPAVSDEGSRTYLLRVANEDESDVPSTCTFTVEYGGSCHCTDYCGTRCSNIETSSGTYNDANTHCIFFQTASLLNLGNNATGPDFTINGISFKNNIAQVCSSESACSAWLATNVGAPVDGGYYMNLSTAWTYVQMTISGSVPGVCSSGN